MSPRANGYDRQAARRKPSEAQLYRSALKALVDEVERYAFHADCRFDSAYWRAKAVLRDRAGRGDPRRAPIAKS